MSDSDSFISEVSEEVRRDRLYAGLRRYGWIAVLLVLVIVAGAGWNEYRKSQTRAEAQDFGSAILGALDATEGSARIAALDSIDPPGPDAAALLALLTAAEDTEVSGSAPASDRLSDIAERADLTPIYRQIASFTALTRATGTLDPQARRIGFEALAEGPLRLLAQEQLALLDIEAGDSQAAIARLEAILGDAGVTQGLRRRASQLIVALGGTLDRA